MPSHHLHSAWLAVRLSIAVAVAITGCTTPTESVGWRGEGIHVVDGYWMLAEHPCDMSSVDPCVQQVHIAETALGVDPARVTGRASAGLPSLWSVRSDGHVSVIMRNWSGVGLFAILDLADGSRRVAGISCPGVVNPDRDWCHVATFDDYRVGAEPSF